MLEKIKIRIGSPLILMFILFPTWIYWMITGKYESVGRVMKETGDGIIEVGKYLKSK